MAGISAATTQKLTQTFVDGSQDGAILTLHQYMHLVRDMVEFPDICEITYLARESPNDWGTRKQLEDLDNQDNGKGSRSEEHALLDVIWSTYFPAQAKLKGRRQENIRMRRVFVVTGCRKSISVESFNRLDKHEKWVALGCPKDQVSGLQYLETEHESANIGLLIVHKGDLPEDFKDGLVLVLCKDGNKWSIKSRYARSNTTVRTWVIDKSTSTKDAARLFKMIDGIVNSGKNDPHLLVRGKDNEARRECWMEKS